MAPVRGRRPLQDVSARLSPRKVLPSASFPAWIRKLSQCGREAHAQWHRRPVPSFIPSSHLSSRAMASANTDPWEPFTREPEDVAQAIARVRASRFSSLDLSKANLTEIPEEVFELVHLSFINLSHNRLEAVPSRLINALPHLRWINLAGNPLKALPSHVILTIDEYTFRRHGHQCEAKKLHVLFGASATIDDSDFLIRQLSRGYPLGSLLVGKQSIPLDGDLDESTRPILEVLDSLESFSSLLQLSLQSIDLGSVPLVLHW
jgi:Leucine-rich repeat (LRR) protein